MNAQQQRRNTAVAVTIIVLVLLIVLGIALFLLIQKKPNPTPAPTPTPVATPSPEPSPTPAPTAERKLLGVHTVIRHDTLWWISDKWYKDPVLWPSIYEINKDEIRDPDRIFPGQKFDIPALTGAVGNLSPEDKSLLSQGYLEAYRVYKEKGKQDAEDYKRSGDQLAK